MRVEKKCDFIILFIVFYGELSRWELGLFYYTAYSSMNLWIGKYLTVSLTNYKAVKTCSKVTLLFFGDLKDILLLILEQ